MARLRSLTSGREEWSGSLVVGRGETGAPRNGQRRDGSGRIREWRSWAVIDPQSHLRADGRHAQAAGVLTVPLQMLRLLLLLLGTVFRTGRVRRPVPPPPSLPARLLLFPSRPQTQRMRHVLLLFLLLFQLSLPAAIRPVPPEYASLTPPPQVGNVLDDLAVTRRRFAVRCAGQRRRRLIARPFQPHPLHFALLGLGELRGYHHQAQVDHEERANLQTSVGGSK